MCLVYLSTHIEVVLFDHVEYELEYVLMLVAVLSEAYALSVNIAKVACTRSEHKAQQNHSKQVEVWDAVVFAATVHVRMSQIER